MGSISGRGVSLLNPFGTFLPLAGGTLTGPLVIPAGTATAAGLQIVGQAGTGIYSAGANSLSIAAGATGQLRVLPDVLRARGTLSISWANGAVDGTLDVGLSRNAAGVLEVNTGTSGTRGALFVSTARVEPKTVATLTAAATAGEGAHSYVTDANTTYLLGAGTTVVGGGANRVPVFSDGTNWRIG